MMLFLVDVDGVVADLHTEWLRRYNLKYDDTLKYTDVKSWGIHEYVKPECGRKIFDILNEPDLYHCTPVIDCAQWGVRSLRELGHRVVFVTAYFNTPKIEWLHNNGFLVEYPYGDGRWNTCTDAVMMNDKQLLSLCADAIIDDRSENLVGFKNPIIFDQPWNQDYKGERAYGWEGVVKWASLL